MISFIDDWMVMLSYTHRCSLNIFLRWHGLTWQLTTVSHVSRKKTYEEKSATICLASFYNWINPFPSSTHLFTCVLGSWVLLCFLVCKGAVAGARSSKVEDTFVPLWRLFGVEFTRAFPKKVGKRLQSFETLWFQYCAIHREMCSMPLRPIQFAICLTLYTSTSYYTILSIDFAAITLTFPRLQKNRGIWIAWLTCC